MTAIGTRAALGALAALAALAAFSALIAIVATTGSLCTVVAQEPRGESTKRHWAYVAPERPFVPRTVRRDWSRGPVDQFIAARLEQSGLAGGGQQDRERLLRRITQALIGLSPTVEQLDEFLADDSPDAIEKTVDRLLASPRRGEHRAAAWLDLARYADTHGYHADTHREMWRWRDWVIEAFNRGMPFSQFTIEQLAGDLLPSPTLDQRIATGFNRNHMVIFENGVIAEEYRTEYVLDRATTVGTVWLGQTLQCARCHDHKHDPWSQRDFYRFAAFFNNVPENGVDGQYGNAVPFISAPTPLQQEQLARLESRRTAAERTLAARRVARPDEAELAWRAAQRTQTNRGAAPPADAAWHLPLDEQDGATTLAAVPQGRELKVAGQPNWGVGRRAGALVLDGETSVSLEQAASCDRFEPLSAALWAFPTGDGPMTLLAKYDGDETQRGFVWAMSSRKLVWSLTARADSDERLEVRTRQPLAARRWQHLAFTYDGTGKAAGVALFVDGQRQEVEVIHDALNSSARTSAQLVLGRRGPDAGWRGLLDDFRLFARSLSAVEIAALADRDPLGELLAAPDDKRSREQEAQLHLAYLERADAGYQAATREVELLDQDLRTLRKSIPTTMVMEELPTPRAAHVLLRGQYDQLGDEVEAGWPEWLSRPSKKAQPQTRSQKRTSTSTSTSSQRAADELPFTRLELALWLVSPDNPLTARVQVDRVWRELFGRGFVSTPEDWGTHGAAPTHPELLDWLAVE
ncbi:MAG TPA: DUF1549 domain-containing protein, partial [Pirellulaceae bacterium]|nr:DUF1549 domain-containing protein [Pirellulaceae bacterium]